MSKVIGSLIRGAVLLALLFAGGSALAERKVDRDDQIGGGAGRTHERGDPPGHAYAYGRQDSKHSVPEFGPAAAGAIAVLVAGGGVLLARRRKH